MALDDKPSWEQLTVDGICKFEAGLSSLSRSTSRANEEFQSLANKADSYQASLKVWAQSLRNARAIMRSHAYKNLDIEAAYSIEYLKHMLKIEDLVSALNFSNEAYSFKVTNPVELLTKTDSSAPCDLFGPDQIGLRAKAAIITKENPPQQFDMTLHMAFGLSLAKTPGNMFLAHAVHLRDAVGIAAYDIAALEALMNKEIRKKLQQEQLPSPQGSGIIQKGKEVQYMTATVENHVSILATVVSQQGYPPIDSHPPIKPLTALPPDAHEVLRFSNYLFFTLMRDRLEEYIKHSSIENLNADNYAYSVVPDPTDSTKRILQLSGSAYCIDPFNDREDLGIVVVTVSFRTQKWPDSKGMDLILQPKGYFKSTVFSGDPITFLSLANATTIVETVGDDAVSVAVRYELKTP